MAWRQPGKLRLPPTRRPASTPPSPPGSWPVVPGRRGAGAVERVDDHTKHPWPSGSWLPPRSATTPSHGRIHDAPKPRPRGLSVIALSPVADVGPARHASRGNVLQDQLAQQPPRPPRRRPRQRAGRGKRGQVERLAPAPDFDPPAGSTIALRVAGHADQRDHAHRPDGPDKAVPPTVGVVHAGCRSSWVAVRRLVLVSARGGDRAAESVRVGWVPVQAGPAACGRRSWAGWWGR